MGLEPTSPSTPCISNKQSKIESESFDKGGKVMHSSCRVHCIVLRVEGTFDYKESLKTKTEDKCVSGLGRMFSSVSPGRLVLP